MQPKDKIISPGNYPRENWKNLKKDGSGRRMRICKICGYPFNAQLEKHWRKWGHDKEHRKDPELVFGKNPVSPRPDWVAKVNEGIIKWVAKTEVKELKFEGNKYQLSKRMSYDTIEHLFNDMREKLELSELIRANQKSKIKKLEAKLGGKSTAD